VGVLVQTNFGGVLQVAGVPVGQALGRYFLKTELDKANADGSVIIILATDAPLSDRNVQRLAARAMSGLARTGSDESNGSGDYVIAFSTAEQVRRHLTLPAPGATPQPPAARPTADLSNDDMSPLFEAVIESTEEAIYNSMFMATTVTSNGHTVEAIPLDKVRAILAKYGVARR